MSSKKFFSKLAGVSHNNDDGSSRTEYINQYAKPGATIFLKREPDNPYSDTATSAWIRISKTSFDLVQIGYLKSDLADELAPKIDAGTEVNVTISEITGGTGRKKNVGVNIQVEVVEEPEKPQPARSMVDVIEPPVVDELPFEIEPEEPKKKSFFGKLIGGVQVVFDWFGRLRKKNKTTFRVLVIVLVFLGLCLCGGLMTALGIEPSSTEAAEPANVETGVAQLMETQQAEQPAAEPEPTAMPKPTATTIPTPTLAPLPDPMVYSGSGSQVINFEQDWPVEGAVLKITMGGGGNNALWAYDNAGEKSDLIVNTIGSYSGLRPLNWINGEENLRLAVESDGNWTIEVLPLDPESLNHMIVPGSYTGAGDDIVALDVGDPDLMEARCDTSGNFAIWGYTDNGGIDLLVNEIAPWSGTVVVPPGTMILDVEADGPWGVNISAR